MLGTFLVNEQLFRGQATKAPDKIPLALRASPFYKVRSFVASQRKILLFMASWRANYLTL
jgi:hypothetical protein